jgi:hypothetical protein
LAVIILWMSIGDTPKYRVTEPIRPQKSRRPNTAHKGALREAYACFALETTCLEGFWPSTPDRLAGASFTSWKLFRVSRQGQGIVVPEAWAATCRVCHRIRHGRAGRSGDHCATASAKPRRHKGLQPRPAFRTLWMSGAQPPSRRRHMAFRCPQDRRFGEVRAPSPELASAHDERRTGMAPCGHFRRGLNAASPPAESAGSSLPVFGILATGVRSNAACRPYGVQAS